MKLRTALLSTFLLFLAGAAMAVPTAGEQTDPAEAGFLAAWDTEPVAAPTGYALVAPAPVQEPTELAIFGPCGCIPIPGCPFPIPWPSPGPTFPFPLPDLCKCPLPF